METGPAVQSVATTIMLLFSHAGVTNVEFLWASHADDVGIDFGLRRNRDLRTRAINTAFPVLPSDTGGPAMVPRHA